MNVGALIVSNPSGSATGAGSVTVNSGTLGGDGTISWSVSVGTGSGSGATLQPSFRTNKQIALTIQSRLCEPPDATITSGDSTYQASYEGGDGNDFALTVQ